MKLLSTWFLAAIALSSASAAASVTGAGRSMLLLRAMERGTMPSISARREASPMTDSMQRFVGGADADVAGDEFGGVFEFARGAGSGHGRGSPSSETIRFQQK